MIKKISVKTRGRGLYEITDEVHRAMVESDVWDGLCTVFIQHTSASLIIQENADPSAKADLENWLNRFIPENDPHYTHVSEGPDDMPSHIRSVLTASSLGVPVMEGRLALGTWQGIYVWEHRRSPHTRSIILHFGGKGR